MTRESRIENEQVSEDMEREERLREEGHAVKPGPSVEVESQPQSMDEDTLLGHDEAERLRGRWESIQASFVDQPREAVSEAEGLLSEVLDSLAKGFSRQRSELESRWGNEGSPSTEDMRVTVQRYRSMFQRLLSA